MCVPDAEIFSKFPLGLIDILFPERNIIIRLISPDFAILLKDTRGAAVPEVALRMRGWLRTVDRGGRDGIPCLSKSGHPYTRSRSPLLGLHQVHLRTRAQVLRLSLRRGHRQTQVRE